jgi:dihydropteroate synthase
MVFGEYRKVGPEQGIHMILKARSFDFVFPRPALVMGIINVTPDSFSDGGQYFDTDAAVQHAVKLWKAGADVLDIGGESTRPFSPPVEEAEELRRVLPVIERLVGRVPVPISIDTQKPGVARAAVAAGASIVNDVGAWKVDASMAALVAETGAGYVMMHSQGTPQTMQIAPSYQDVVAEVEGFFEGRLQELGKLGVRLEQVILDPGIGFGKSMEHNLELLAAMGRFKHFGRPLLIGVSRKSFIGKLLGVEVDGRLPGALACACWGMMEGVQIVRVHDVSETVQVLRMTEALMARKC